MKKQSVLSRTAIWVGMLFFSIISICFPHTLYAEATEDTPEIYYAVDAAYQDCVEKTADGTTYLDPNDALGSSIVWHVNAAKKGNYMIIFHAANGTESNLTMRIVVNEGAEYWVQPFLPTGSETTWEECNIVLPLKAGINKIEVISNTENGGPNFAYLTMQPTDEPYAATYDENANSDTSPDDSGKTAIYIAGDSTCHSYSEKYAPQQGWGYYISEYIPSDYRVINRAIPGRSSKSFYDFGDLDKILNEIQAGDFFLIQFGINDASYSFAERTAPVCGNVENPEKGSFEYYITLYILGAKEKGATPILITPTLRIGDASSGKFSRSFTGYCNALEELAKYYNVSLIDLNGLLAEDYNRIGYDAVKSYYLYGVVEGCKDVTHFCDAGARNAAKICGASLTPILQQYTAAKQTNTYKPGITLLQDTFFINHFLTRPAA